MIDPQSETLLPLKAVGRMFPGRSGNGISRSAVWRWVLEGRRGHKLETILVGGERYSSREAVARFLRGINTDENQPSPADARHDDSLRTDARLDAAGL